MVLRWTAAGILEAERQFRRIVGYRDLHILKRALEAHREVVASTKTGSGAFSPWQGIWDTT